MTESIKANQELSIRERMLLGSKQDEQSKTEIKTVEGQASSGAGVATQPLRFGSSASAGFNGVKVPSNPVPGVVGSQPVVEAVVVPSATVSSAPVSVVVASKSEPSKPVEKNVSQPNLQKQFSINAKARIKAHRIERELKEHPWSSSLSEIELMRNDGISWAIIAEDLNNIYGTKFDLTTDENRKSSGMSLAKQVAKFKKELKAKV